MLRLPVPPSSAAGTENVAAEPTPTPSQPSSQAPESSHAHACPQFNENGPAAEGGVPLEAEVNDADPQELNVIHDPEQPNIE